MKSLTRHSKTNHRPIEIIAAVTTAVIFLLFAASSCGSDSVKVTEAAAETTVHDTPNLSDLEYPFSGISFDWDDNTLNGWRHYDLPDEYVRAGGYLPDAVQVYAYALCREMDVDYPMVLAVIEIESGYKYNAVSQSGALGYMQIIPKWHRERLGNPSSDEAFLDPYLNLYAGISYLAELSEKFDSQDMVLTAYHCGVSGAYKSYFNRGKTNSPYSDKVLTAASRIRSTVCLE